MVLLDIKGSEKNIGSTSINQYLKAINHRDGLDGHITIGLLSSHLDCTELQRLQGRRLRKGKRCDEDVPLGTYLCCLNHHLESKLGGSSVKQLCRLAHMSSPLAGFLTLSIFCLDWVEFRVSRPVSSLCLQGNTVVNMTLGLKQHPL